MRYLVIVLICSIAGVAHAKPFTCPATEAKPVVEGVQVKWDWDEFENACHVEIGPFLVVPKKDDGQELAVISFEGDIDANGIESLQVSFGSKNLEVRYGQCDYFAINVDGKKLPANHEKHEVQKDGYEAVYGGVEQDIERLLNAKTLKFKVCDDAYVLGKDFPKALATFKKMR